MHNDKESLYTLTLLDSGLSLQVLQFRGAEGLNRPYRFDIEVIGLAPAMNLDPLLHQPALLMMGDRIAVHGILHSASREHRGPHCIGYHLVLVPHLQTLDRHRCRRVFHHLSVPAILRQLFQEHALPQDSYRLELASVHYPPRPFCIQYEESDLTLMQRLCEEEGIHYHFEHRCDGHVLVLADDSQAFPQEPILLPFHEDALSGTSLPVISELSQRHNARALPARRVANNRGFQAMGNGAANHTFGKTSPLTGRPAPEQAHREQLSRRSLERLRCQHRQIEGQSNQAGLRSGSIVQVTEHPVSGFNDQWLITDVQHGGQQPSILADQRPRRYSNQFTAIPWSTEFRPALTHIRPSIPGYQRAVVLGVAGQPAALDEQHQIHVRLWPALQEDADESAGLWLPVAFATPQAGIDPSSLPLAGTEVLISFLDSDPDRPVLCATVFNPPKPRAAYQPRSDGRLLLDWLINR
ncbi:type VI secretion system Vgr family protein [Pseudomonas arsenicoxydans]|uniref:Type VI secretion system tip protein VgrG n=1 Tax=Pseudomonas arsenicoxydans TaxID=702115 RepID=A0A502HZ19_9PSED|nr:type VI secretion system tip protein TssI/VgrG [Pseudomonas arsenicoxydans]TPG78586.1 type VI secretion system tip protein VgrG [Pseudomonas arsenicoxydans]